MASGARTILLSRWRTGGQTSYDLVREFAQELPHTTPADAWQRAVLVVADSRLNLEAEPRVKKETVDEPPKAEPSVLLGRLHADRSGQSRAGQHRPAVINRLNRSSPWASRIHPRSPDRRLIGT